MVVAQLGRARVEVQPGPVLLIFGGRGQGAERRRYLAGGEVVVAGQDSLYASACIDAATKELIIKVVNASDKAQNNTLQLDGVKKLAAKGKLLTMQSDLTAVNSFDSPTNVAPVESTIAIKGKKIQLNNSPYSFSVLRVKLE